MEIEIRFKDRLGKFRYSLSAGFMSCGAAARYALEVMKIGMCRHYASAEICPMDSSFPIVVAHSRNPHFLDLRGRLRHSQGGKIVSMVVARQDMAARITRPLLTKFRD